MDLAANLVFLGCGRFFEGNAAEMDEALNKRLAALPDDTVVYVSIFYWRRKQKEEWC